MPLVIRKHIYFSPFVRLNLYTRGCTVSFGHRSIGWITLGRRGIRETIPTGIPGAYLTESQSWSWFGKWRGWFWLERE
jgi:hypothetical protein